MMQYYGNKISKLHTKWLRD